MAKIKIWPHEEICPNGAEIESLPDETICEAALRNKIKIEKSLQIQFSHFQDSMHNYTHCTRIFK